MRFLHARRARSRRRTRESPIPRPLIEPFWTRVYAYTFINGVTIHWTIINCMRVPLCRVGPAFMPPHTQGLNQRFIEELERIVEETEDWAHEAEAEFIPGLVMIDVPHSWFPGWENVVFNENRNTRALSMTLMEYAGMSN